MDVVRRFIDPMMEGSEGVRLDVIFLVALFLTSETLGSVLHATLDGVIMRIWVTCAAAVRLAAVADELADKHSDLLAGWNHVSV